MANYNTLISAIQSVITANGNNEITGPILQQTLISIINSLGSGYQFVGVAKPNTNPGTPDQNVFYLAGAGTYPNFGGCIITYSQIGIFLYNGSWIYEKLSNDNLQRVYAEVFGYGSDTPETNTLNLEQGGTDQEGEPLPSTHQVTPRRIRTASRVRVYGDFFLTFQSGFLYNIFFYATETSPLDHQIGTWGSGDYSGNWDGYIMIGIRNSTDTNITPSDTVVTLTQAANIPGLKQKVESLLFDTDRLNMDMYGYGSDTPETNTLNLEQGGTDQEGEPLPSTHQVTPRRIRTASRVRVYGDFFLTFQSGFLYNIFFYATETSPLDHQIGTWGSGDYSGNWDGYIMIGIRNSTDTNITPSDTVVTLTQVHHILGVKEKVDTLFFSPDGYVFDASLIKQPIRTKRIGLLEYQQSFCVYGGKYYSINGNRIAEQNDVFSVIRSVSLNTGHGNSLQLGHNGLAYASGWDNQKLYVINLATLTIVNTIDLPTTGYTTCAVDDVRKLAYIFQRNTYPDVADNYNFIIYDYYNEQIVSTRILDEQFAAMQACDYIEGKIVMLYGLGTSTAPSGMKVFNTSGGVLVSYILNIFNDTEPEGVCYDRATGRLLVSDVNKNVFEIYR